MHGCAETQALFSIFSWPAPPQSTHLLRAESTKQQLKFSLPGPTKSLIRQNSCISICLLQITGCSVCHWVFLLAQPFEKELKLQRRAMEAEDGYFSTVWGEKTMVWVFFVLWKGRSKLLLTWSVLWVRQASSSHPGLLYLACLAAEVSARSKGGSGFTCVCVCMGGSNVCIYYKEKLQMETTQLGVQGPVQSPLKSAGVIPFTMMGSGHISLCPSQTCLWDKGCSHLN